MTQNFLKVINIVNVVINYFLLFFYSRGGRKKKNEESQVLWMDKDEETERSRLSRELETPKLF